MSVEDLERRLEEMEVRHAYQDRTIELLDEVVRELFGKVEQLERRMEELREHLADPQGEEAPLEEQVPPHY
ncbi:MAG: SlyX family protein [Alphaproteobacteria bacterium]|nr:SlyX family protein [Alphaproteobacteria bacterium]